MKDLSNYRRSYEQNTLSEENIPDDPLRLFFDWFNEVDGTDFEANAMTVSTVDADGHPRSRVVLLKQFSGEGFVFYTNYNSAKGRALIENPKVCLSFFWPFQERQVIIKGIASKTTAEDSDQYFNTRPIGSKLAAWVSNQSEVISSRAELEEKLAQLEAEVADKNIQRPEYWGGFNVSPVEIEFWQGRANRLHDRIRYRRQSTDSEVWISERLSP
jgi:pyridoxamine 5'-phosphate oxidase